MTLERGNERGKLSSKCIFLAHPSIFIFLSVNHELLQAWHIDSINELHSPNSISIDENNLNKLPFSVDNLSCWKWGGKKFLGKMLQRKKRTKEKVSSSCPVLPVGDDYPAHNLKQATWTIINYLCTTETESLLLGKTSPNGDGQFGPSKFA